MHSGFKGIKKPDGDYEKIIGSSCNPLIDPYRLLEL